MVVPGMPVGSGWQRVRLRGALAIGPVPDRRSPGRRQARIPSAWVRRNLWVPKRMLPGRMRRGGHRVSARGWRLVAGLHAAVR
jgi:hypothetical protein